MPDVKLQPLLEAIHPKKMLPQLQRFFGELPKPPKLLTSRLQAPTCYWAVYGAGGDSRVTFKSFFSGELYQDYTGQLQQYYPDQLDVPAHPAGGIVFIPELNGVLWSFPFDPHMPKLPRCTDAGWIAELMERSPAAPPLSTKLVDYNPEIGTILAYRDARRTVAYGKVAADDKGSHVFDIMERLWYSTERVTGELRVAEPIAYLPEAGFLLQSAVFGKPVQPRRNKALFLELVNMAARAAALIHGCDVTTGPERRLESELDRLRRGLGELELTAPDLHETLRLLLLQIDARISEPGPIELVPSHGDYKWNQLLHANGKFALIDFELFCQAERWLDIGYFCAYLVPTSPEDWRDGMATEMLRSTFLTTYAEAAGVPLDLDRIALYEASTLALRALTVMWQHQGRWHLRASELLDLAMDRLVSPEPKRIGPQPVVVLSFRSPYASVP